MNEEPVNDPVYRAWQWTWPRIRRHAIVPLVGLLAASLSLLACSALGVPLGAWSWTAGTVALAVTGVAWYQRPAARAARRDLAAEVAMLPVKDREELRFSERTPEHRH